MYMTLCTCIVKHLVFISDKITSGYTLPVIVRMLVRNGIVELGQNTYLITGLALCIIVLHIYVHIKRK